MPTPAPSPEALARAVLEKPPAAGVLTPAQERARALRQKTTKEGPRSTLDSLRRPVGRAEVAALLDKNFGIDIDPATGRKLRAAGSAEETRFNQTKSAAEIYSNYLEKGYDGLSPVEKAFVKGEIKGVLTAWPPGETFINTLTAAEQDELYETILKGQEQGENKLPTEVRKLLGERMAQSEIIKDEVTEKKRKFEELQQKETDKQSQVTLNATELGSVTGNLAQFETVAGTPGAKLKELERLRKIAPKLTQEIDEKQDQLENASRQLSRLENQRDMLLISGTSTAAVDALISAKETAITGLKTEISRGQQQLDKKASLETEKTNLETRKKTLEENSEKLRQELQEAVRQRTMAQADLMSAKNDRTDKEEKFAGSIRDLFADASVKYLLDKIQKAEAADRDLFDEEKARAGDPGEKAVLQQILDRWQTANGKLIEGQVRMDYTNLINRSRLVGGPDNLTKRMLDSAVTAGMLTTAEANTKKNDPAFLEKIRVQVAEGLISQYIKLGKFSEAEAERIIKTDWGKDVIDKAWQGNENIKNALQAYRDKGLLKGLGPAPLEFLGKLNKKDLLKWLLYLFGGLAIGAVGGPLLLKALPH